MEITTIVWALIFVAMVAGVYIFMFKGRSLGYKCLAARSLELQRQGVERVYLLCSLKDVGLNVPPANLWTFINTGYLGYKSGDSFIVEFPWWDKMQHIFTVRSTQAEVRLSDNAATIWNKQPGIRINKWNFVVAGINLTDAAQVKRATKYQGLTPQQAVGYRDALAAELH